MSILGYSASYFLPEYWSNTPFYGEKLIPLLDYMLSNEYEYSDKLAQAFYNIENKYKNQADLPIEQVEAIIDENGYSYIRDLLGNNEESIRLLLSLMVLIHQLKGTKLGIIAVLNLLRKDSNIMTMQVVGSPTISEVTKDVSNFSLNNYVIFNGFMASGSTIQVDLKFSGFNLNEKQCLFSVSDKGLLVEIDTEGHFIVSLGSNRLNWDIVDHAVTSRVLTVGNEYYVRLQYDGYEYTLQVSLDGKNYDIWFSQVSDKSLNINNGLMYIGINASEGGVSEPFSGYINFSNFSVDLNNVEITQWFEQTPVGPENTFIIKAGMDVDLVSSSFFDNFSNFVKNYVYPSLQLFTANLAVKNSIVIIPYNRNVVDYVAKV